MSDVPRRMQYKKKGETQPENQPWVGEKGKNVPENYKKFVEKQTTEKALKEMSEFREKHNRFPDRKEMEELVENIYRQVEQKNRKNERRHKSTKQKKEKSLLEQRKSRRQKLVSRRKKSAEERGGKEPPKEDGKKPVEDEEEIVLPKEAEKDVSVSDLFGKDEPENDFELKEFPEEGGGLKGLGAGSDDLKFLDEEESQDKCPNCKTPTQNVFFCPKCGTGFCQKCAKKIAREQEGLRLVCPKCSNEFVTRKME